MKWIILTICIVCSTFSGAQTSEQLDINNINATVNTIRSAQFQGSFFNAGFEVPQGSGKNTIYATNLWIGALDSGSNVCLGANVFGPGTDFIPGPIMDSIQYLANVNSWNRVWTVYRSDINYHIANFSQTGYVIPQVFLDWPAHGNTSLGQAANLAPFFDYNNDGVYNPALGDYPLVPGDKCVYYIFNDDTVHTNTGGKKMKIEVHAFVYAFDCSIDNALFNTVFMKYRLINRSNQTYYNTSVGQWTDIDLGGTTDDYIGCDIQRGAYFGYNGDSDDESYNGVIGYDSLPPAQAVVFLAGPNKDHDAMDNPFTTDITQAIDSLGIPYEGLGLNYGDGIIDNERLGLTGFVYYYNSGQGGNLALTDPTNATDYYNYLNSIWLDGTQMVHGGNGHITSGASVPAHFMFPGDSDPLYWGTNGVAVPVWTEVTAGNVAGDRRGIGHCGKFTFSPNTIHELDLAFVFAQSNDTLISAIGFMQTYIDSVRNYFSNNITPCGASFLTPLSLNKYSSQDWNISIYPNPSSSQFTLSYSGEEKNLSYSIHDILGKEIISGRINSSTTQIDCSKWSRGVYLIRIGNENGYSVKKMVVE